MERGGRWGPGGHGCIGGLAARHHQRRLGGCSLVARRTVRLRHGKRGGSCASYNPSLPSCCPPVLWAVLELLVVGRQGNGCEQGDALAPALFALALHAALSAAAAKRQEGKLLLAFLDDLYLVTRPERVQAFELALLCRRAAFQAGSRKKASLKGFRMPRISFVRQLWTNLTQRLVHLDFSFKKHMNLFSHDRPQGSNCVLAGAWRSI